MGQQDIRIITCPELLAANLFCKELEENEALVAYGVLQFCNFIGFRENFKFVADQEHYPCLVSRPIIFIDALNFSSASKKPIQQYETANVERELTKAYTGFKVDLMSPGIASGLWGCGYCKVVY